MQEFDHRQDFLNSLELLPDIFQTEVNKTVLNNSVNRLLTKPDTVKISGTIGDNSKNSTVKRIKEESDDRQAYQLQPLIYSDNNISSFKDILNKLKLICGNDVIDRQNIWGETEQFDFAPPINFDKFLNYKDYYWTGEYDPDYITIHNPSNSSDMNLKSEWLYKLNNMFHPNEWLTKTIPSHYFWINDNKWIHKSDLKDVNAPNIIQAKIPILEYKNTIEVNEWIYTKHNWMYRKDVSQPWESSENGPTDDELNLRYPIIDISNKSFTIKKDFSWFFVEDIEFIVYGTENNNRTFTVNSSSYDSNNDTTIISVTYVRTESLKDFTVPYDNNDNFMVGKYYGFITPFTETSKSSENDIHPWHGLHNHWAWSSQDSAKPINHQKSIEQKYYHEVIDDFGFNVGGFDSLSGYDGKRTVEFDFDYVYDTDDLQVYINGVRQYTTYDEIIKHPKGQYGVNGFDNIGYDKSQYKHNVLSNMIDFNIPLNYKDEILVKVGPACKEDEYRHYVPVNIYNESLKDNFRFNTIRFKNLMEYRIKEQVKFEHTYDGKNRLYEKPSQYINFDIYNIKKETAYKANPIFKYKEDILVNISETLNQKTPIYNHNFIFENLLAEDNILYCYNDGEWFTNDNIHTIWRKCTSNYIPKKINVYHESDENGMWEIHKPFINNINNECRNDILFSELRKHCSTILDGQKFEHKLFNDYEYVGGNIQIFNNRYNLLVSSLHQNFINFESVLHFMMEQYAEQLNSIKLESIKSFPRIFNYNSTEENIRNYNLDDFIKYVEKEVYLDVTNNIQKYVLFHDATTVDGIKNFVPTLPILGFKKASKPLLLIDKNIRKIKHHDGHLSDLDYTLNEIYTIITSFKLYNDTLSEKIIITSDSIKIDNKGCYKIENDKIYRCKVDAIGNWNDPIWDEINLNDVYNHVLMKVENELYALSIVPKFKYADIVNNEFKLLYQLLHKEYVKFAKYNNHAILDNDFDIKDPFSYNYKYAPQYLKINYQNSSLWSAKWYEIYELQYGTAYPHLEPWKLQGFDDKPDGWDTYYKDGNYWKVEMWDNIRKGIVPNIFKAVKNVPTYSILSVNDTGMKIGNYDRDDLLPPYIKNSQLEHHSLIIDDIFNATHNGKSIIEIPLVFGDQNSYERLWRDSIHYNYDLLLVLFKMQPLKMINYTFRDNYYNIDGLIIDESGRVLGNSEIIFHGTLVDGKLYKSNSMNQSYIQALRNTNNAYNIEKFINEWNTWESKISYQTDSIINTKSLKLDHDIFDIVEDDYKPLIKKSPNAEEKWIHSLYISLDKSGKKSVKNSLGLSIPRDSGEDWTFRIDVKSVENNIINYFDVKEYSISSVNMDDNTLILNHHKQINFPDNLQVYMNYTSNYFDSNYIYYIKNIDYNTFKLYRYDEFNLTYYEVKLYEEIRCYDFIYNPKTSAFGTYNLLFTYKLSITSGDVFTIPHDNIAIIANGKLLDDNDYSILNNKVFLNKSDKFVLNDTLEIYEIVDVAFNDYDLQYDKQSNKLLQYKALSNRWLSYGNNEFLIPYTTDNIKIFNNGVEISDYTITNNKVTLGSSVNINRMIVKIGIPKNTKIKERVGTFQSLYGKSTPIYWEHLAIDDSDVKTLNLPIIVTGIQNVINIIDGYHAYLQSIGFRFNDYYSAIMDPINTDRIISWQLEIEKFIDKVFSGFNKKFDIVEYNSPKIYDYISINPFKYDLWLETPQGIVSNIIKNPYNDLILYPNVYDNYGDPITSIENLKIFRTDKLTHISYPMRSDINAPYIGGMRIFIDHYEHVIQFNDYTTNFNMMYDSFLGLYNNNIKLELYKHYESIRRPNIGGGFLTDNHIVDNIESSMIGFGQIYDTYADVESKVYINDARELLGYDRYDYRRLDTKSDFLFWKGMIHYKGTNEALDAYISKPYKDIQYTGVKMDEYWLYKIADYGTDLPKYDQYIKLFKEDVYNHNVQLSFDEIVDYFSNIKLSDASRWKNIYETSYGHVEYYLDHTMRYINNIHASISKSDAKLYDFSDYPYIVLDTFVDKLEIFAESNYGKRLSLTYNHDSILFDVDTVNIKEIIVGNYKPNYTIISDNLLEVELVSGETMVIIYHDKTIELPFYIQIFTNDYIPHSNMIKMFIDGKLVNHYEYDYNSIGIPANIDYKNKNIVILYDRAKLSEEIHYKILKSDVIKMLIDDHFDVLDVNIFKYNYKILDIGLVDESKNTFITPIHYYHPAISVYPSEIDEIDFILKNDPANYGETFWANNEVGKKWLDIKNLGYYYYHDKKVYPKSIDRISLWGYTSEWSHVNCYEWFESDIAPYDNKEGKPYTLLYKRMRNSIDDPWTDWEIEENTHQLTYGFKYPIIDRFITIPLELNIEYNVDEWYVFVNEIRTVPYETAVDGNIIASLTLENIEEKDTIRIIRLKDPITIDNIDAYSSDVFEYKIEYPYNEITIMDDMGLFSTKKYYYWVNNLISSNHGLPIKMLENNFIYNDNPYVMLDDSNKWIIKNVNGYVEYENVLLQIIKNKTLKSYLPYNHNLHNAYSEWFKFRELSLNAVPRILWDKIKYSILNSPDYGKVLYDSMHGTNIRYGINDEQVLGDSKNIIKSIRDLMYSKDFNFYNKEAFLEQYDMNSNFDIMLDEIYNTFENNQINKIFFTLLKDMFSYNKEIDGIFKTSMVGLNVYVEPLVAL